MGSQAMGLVTDNQVESSNLLEYGAIFLTFQAVNWRDDKRLTTPACRTHAVEVFTQDAKEEAEMFIHFVLPLESETCGTNNEHALRRLPAHETSYEEASFDGFSQADIVGEHVTKAIRTKHLVEEEGLMRQGLDGGFGEASGDVVFSNNKTDCKLAVQR